MTLRKNSTSQELEALTLFFGKTDSDFKVGVKNIEHWVEQWVKNEEDNSLYEKEDYVYDAWECFKVYSKNYVKLTTDFLNTYKFNSILDYGAGLGLTTKLLANNFPDKQVYYLNLRGSQWDFSSNYLSNTPNVKMIENITSLGDVDVVCAWEFFEHIKKPCEILDKILQLNPNILSIANSFGATAYGHYSTYECGGELFTRKTVSKAFNKHLKLKGYKINPHTHQFWNNRPTLWEKIF